MEDGIRFLRVDPTTCRDSQSYKVQHMLFCAGFDVMREIKKVEYPYLSKIIYTQKIMGQFTIWDFIDREVVTDGI